MMSSAFDREIAEMHVRALREAARHEQLAACAKQLRRRKNQARAAAAGAQTPRPACPKDIG